MNNLKDYRDKELKLYIIANIFLILAICNGESYTEADKVINYIKNINEFLNLSLILGFLSIITFLFDSIYSSNAKSKLLNIFGIIKEPGEKIFTKLLNNNYKDNRINF